MKLALVITCVMCTLALVASKSRLSDTVYYPELQICSPNATIANTTRCQVLSTKNDCDECVEVKNCTLEALPKSNDTLDTCLKVGYFDLVPEGYEFSSLHFDFVVDKALLKIASIRRNLAQYVPTMQVDMSAELIIRHFILFSSTYGEDDDGLPDPEVEMWVDTSFPSSFDDNNAFAFETQLYFQAPKSNSSSGYSVAWVVVAIIAIVAAVVLLFVLVLRIKRKSSYNDL